jgi:hypothetical protein
LPKREGKVYFFITLLHCVTNLDEKQRRYIAVNWGTENPDEDGEED